MIIGRLTQCRMFIAQLNLISESDYESTLCKHSEGYNLISALQETSKNYVSKKNYSI